MKEWLTAREIANASLPNLPATESGVIRLAKSQGWDDHPAFCRGRTGRGGGFEYHFRVLPTLAQVAYMQRHMVVAANEDAAEPVPEPDTAALSGRARSERDARLAIVDAFERFARGLPRLRQASHLQLFCDKYQTGTLAVDSWVKDLIPTVSKRSLLRWMSVKRQGRINDLAVDRGAARKGTGVLDTANGRHTCRHARFPCGTAQGSDAKATDHP